VLLSGTFRSLPIAGNEFPSVQSQSIGGQALALNIPGGPNQTSLGRPFGSGQVVEFLNIVQPGVKYGDRLNAIDLRFGKLLKFGTTKTLVSVDVFNLLNANTTEKYQVNYGTTYANPLSIMSARFFKIGAQFDF
jgi:hypothetical protein